MVYQEVITEIIARCDVWFRIIDFCVWGSVVCNVIAVAILIVKRLRKE